MTAPAEAAEADAAGPDYSTGIMVALMLPETVAAEMALPDGLPPGELHVTLAYLGSVLDVEDPAQFLQDLLSAVSAAAEDNDPVEGVISGIGRFTGDDEAAGDPFYASLDAPGLDELRVDLVRELRDAGLDPSATHGFTPHITLAYVPRESAAPLPRLEEPRELSIPALTVMYGQARIDVALGAHPAEMPRTVKLDADPSTDEAGSGPLTAEEIADPRTWGDLYTLRTWRGGAKSAPWEETAHPRAPKGASGGGRFAPKQQPAGSAAGAGSQLPPDWLNRVLAGDAAFVKPSGGGRKKGKGKGKAKSAATAAAIKAARDRVRAARSARSETARRNKDQADLAELRQRDQFDSETERVNLEENAQRAAANAAIVAETDSAKKAALRTQELNRRAVWEQQQKIRHARERARRRAYEINRRLHASQLHITETTARAQEAAAVAAAGQPPKP